MKDKALIAAVFAGALLFGGMESASAEVFSFSFVADTNDSSDANYGVLSVIGDLYTAGAGLPSALTGISGFVTSDGTSGITSGAITGLSLYAGADNTLQGTVAPGQVTFSGISFSEGAQTFNLYSWNGTFPNGADYALASVVDPTGFPQNGVVGTLTVTAVPEISTWAMLLLGFASLGFAGHRASRRAAPMTV